MSKEDTNPQFSGVQQDVKIKSLLDKVERVALGAITVHPRNPRRGDIAAIAESLQENQQFRPLIVQKSTGHIIAGNHSYKAMKTLGWTHADIVRVDVNDKKARRIMLADNKTSSMGSYSVDLLAELLEGLDGDLVGTGYSSAEVDQLLHEASERDNAMLGEIEQEHLNKRFAEAPLGEEDERDVTHDSLGDYDDTDVLMPTQDGPTKDHYLPPGVAEADDTLPGMSNFKYPDEVNFPGVGDMGITELDPGMLMRWSELPEKLVTWGEAYSRDKLDPASLDPETWWLYNWGTGSTSGMDDLSQVIISFYVHDVKFEPWWSTPDKYAAKLVNSGVKYMIAPDFSMMPGAARALNVFNVYRTRFIARYMQECGIKVIPTIDWPVNDAEFMRRYIVATLPKGLPMIAVQFQAFDPAEIVTLGQTMEEFTAEWQEMLDLLQPQGVLVYAGDKGQKWFKESLTLPHENVRYLDSRWKRLTALRETRPTHKKGGKATI